MVCLYFSLEDATHLRRNGVSVLHFKLLDPDCCGKRVKQRLTSIYTNSVPRHIDMSQHFIKVLNEISQSLCSIVADFVATEVQSCDHVFVFKKRAKLDHMFISKVLVCDLNHVRIVNSPCLEHRRETFCYWSILIEHDFMKQVLYRIVF